MNLMYSYLCDITLEKRAEATYAEYRRQKASGSGGHGFRLPLW